MMAEGFDTNRRPGSNNMAAISTGALIGLGALSAGTQIYGQHKAIGAQQQASREAYAVEDRRAQEAAQLAREQERWNRQMQARREERLNPYRVMAMHSLSNAIPGGFQDGQLPRFRTPRPEAFDPQYVMRDDPMLGGQQTMAALAPQQPRYDQVSATGVRGPRNTKVYSPQVAAQEAAAQAAATPMTMEERIAEWNNPQLAGAQWHS
jgi:hypothetical protein